jgi:hypothetical protein
MESMKARKIGLAVKLNDVISKLFYVPKSSQRHTRLQALSVCSAAADSACLYPLQRRMLSLGGWKSGRASRRVYASHSNANLSRGRRGADVGRQTSFNQSGHLRPEAEHTNYLPEAPQIL